MFSKQNEMHRIGIQSRMSICLNGTIGSRCFVLRKHFQSVNARSVSLPLILLKENYIPELDV